MYSPWYSGEKFCCFIGLHDVFDFHKIDVCSFAPAFVRTSFHKKLGKSPFFMLTKVILLKALFEEEIRRRRAEGYRVSHIHLYGMVLRVVDYLSFFISSLDSRNEKKIASSEFNTRT